MPNVTQAELFSPHEHICALRRSHGLPDGMENLSPLLPEFIAPENPVDNTLYVPADLREAKFCSGTHTFKWEMKKN